MFVLLWLQCGTLYNKFDTKEVATSVDDISLDFDVDADVI